MSSLFNFAARTPVILVSFLAALAIGWSFGLLQAAMGGAEILDMTRDADAARDKLAAMSPEVRRIHFIGTLTLDLAYPLSLLTFLSGVIYRFAPGALATPLAFLPLAATIVDFAENTLILFVLSGYDSLIEAKSLMTQIKFPAFTVAVGLALLCLVYGILKRVFVQKN